MALPLKATLGELRAELLGRLGYAAQGARAGALVTTVDSYLKRAQSYLYWKYEFPELRLTYDWSTAKGQTLYDWPDNMEPRQLIELRVLYSDIWHPMREGIEYDHDSVVDTQYYPRRYDRRAQLEIWPQPDGIYTMRGEYYQRLGRFTQDNDRVTLDEDLVFTLALARAKRHYKHPDAADYFEEIKDRRRQLQGAAHGNKRYFVGREETEAQPKPVVVE